MACSEPRGLHEAARVHHASRRRGGHLAARRARTTADDTGGGILPQHTGQAVLLHELIPGTSVIATLTDSTFPEAVAELREVEEASRTIGQKIVPVNASNEAEIDAAFASIAQAGAGALVVMGGPFFTSKIQMLVALSARYAIPAIYDLRDYVAVGGLISYGASFTDAYRQAGVYAGRILKGSKPSELPVLQPTTFELAINRKTARILGLNVPQSLIARADEMIE
jgi:putative ABC transport system substrate-binding protein